LVFFFGVLVATRLPAAGGLAERLAGRHVEEPDELVALAAAL
jgi:hypothetical protein